MARDGLGQENIPIRITNLSLTVDDMNKALQQVGGGYLFCQLNRDGTAITVVPQGGLTLGEAGRGWQKSMSWRNRFFRKR